MMKSFPSEPPLNPIPSDSLPEKPSPEKPRYCRIPSALLSPTCVSFTSISASIF